MVHELVLLAQSRLAYFDKSPLQDTQMKVWTPNSLSRRRDICRLDKCVKYAQARENILMTN